MAAKPAPKPLAPLGGQRAIAKETIASVAVLAAGAVGLSLLFWAWTQRRKTK